MSPTLPPGQDFHQTPPQGEVVRYDTWRGPHRLVFPANPDARMQWDRVEKPDNHGGDLLWDVQGGDWHELRDGLWPEQPTNAGSTSGSPASTGQMLCSSPSPQEQPRW